MDIANSIRNPNERTLTVAELASIFGISSQTVRLYHKEGLLMPVSVDENGYHRYSYNQIHTLAMICYLRKGNQPIAKIRAYLQNDNVADSLAALHGAIDEMKLHQQEIQRAIDVLENKVQFVEQQLSQIGEEKPEIHAYPMRFYVRLGTEFSASSSSAFFRYPALKLADQAYCVNVIDQFLESSQSAYVVRAQIRAPEE